MNIQNDILKQTKQALQDIPHGVFVLAGDEEYLKRNFVSDIKKRIFADEMSLSFDCASFSGEDAYYSVSDMLEQFPMTSERRVVFWYAPPVFDKANEKKMTELCTQIKENPDALLVLYLYPEDADTSDRSKNARLSALGTLFCFDTLPKTKLYGWVRRHFAAEECEVDDEENAFLCESVCCDMTRLASEISKLCAYMNEKGQKKVSRQMIESIVSPEIVFENFYLSGRIGERDGEGVIRYFKKELDSGTDPIMLLGSFTAEVEKLARIKTAMIEGYKPEAMAKLMGMHEYALKLKLTALRNFKEKDTKELLDACYFADAEMKSTAGDKVAILYRLACLL